MAVQLFVGAAIALTRQHYSLRCMAMLSLAVSSNAPRAALPTAALLSHQVIVHHRGSHHPTTSYYSGLRDLPPTSSSVREHTHNVIVEHLQHHNQTPHARPAPKRFRPPRGNVSFSAYRRVFQSNTWAVVEHLNTHGWYTHVVAIGL